MSEVSFGLLHKGRYYLLGQTYICLSVNYIYEGQTLVLPCYVLSTIYYQPLLFEIVVDDEIVDESINEMKSADTLSSFIGIAGFVLCYLDLPTSRRVEDRWNRKNLQQSADVFQFFSPFFASCIRISSDFLQFLFVTDHHSVVSVILRNEVQHKIWVSSLYFKLSRLGCDTCSWTATKFQQYQEPLLRLVLESLEVRLLRFNLIMCFRIVHGLVDLDRLLFFNFPGNSRTRDHSLKFVKPFNKNVQFEFSSKWIRIVYSFIWFVSNFIKKLNLDKFLKGH